MIGTLLPLIVMVIFAGATRSSLIQVILTTFFYFTNPMFTFYLANYQIVISYVNQQTPDHDPIAIPLVGGLHANFWLSIGCFFLQFVAFMSLVMYKDEKESLKFRAKDKRAPRIEQPQMEINQDVKNHEKDIRKGEWPILAEKIHKTYPNGLHAVCGNSFGVKKGSIMGLLGPNGAGKSSTFGMLAMDLPISQGDAFILNENISHINLTKEGRDLGMCP